VKRAEETASAFLKQGPCVEGEALAEGEGWTEQEDYWSQRSRLCREALKSVDASIQAASTEAEREEEEREPPDETFWGGPLSVRTLFSAFPPRLEELFLDNSCVPFVDAWRALGVLLETERLSRIRKLGLSYCQLNDSTVSALARRQPSSLTWLNLSGNPKVSVKGWRVVGRAVEDLPDLRLLRLDECVFASEGRFEAFCSLFSGLPPHLVKFIYDTRNLAVWVVVQQKFERMMRLQ